MKVKTCQYCYYAKEAAASSRTILICDRKYGCEAKFFVVAPDDTCANFKVTETPPSPESDGAKLIPLTRGKFAIVDTEDYDHLSKHKWCATKNSQTFYACRARRGKKVFMHRLIANAPAGLLVDHIDGNGLNNQKHNLRLCTITQNARNRGPNRNASSRYKGISWSKCCKKWQARIRPNRKTIHLGLFDNEIQAGIAYDRKAEELFGEFAYLNFPSFTAENAEK